MLCFDSSSYDLERGVEHDVSWSPNSAKLVDTCKNCSFTFRIGSKNASEGFCSKDCKTCYTLFYKPGSCSASPVATGELKTAQEVKHAIFQFQCQIIDKESLRFITPDYPITDRNARCGDDKDQSRKNVLTPQRHQSSRFRSFF